MYSKRMKVQTYSTVSFLFFILLSYCSHGVFYLLVIVGHYYIIVLPTVERVATHAVRIDDDEAVSVYGCYCYHSHAVLVVAYLSR
mmetsp:Transcript_40011/g.40538  ORF Transcript_40011/g.40538 Transcript_40011/m.40538 type:complete len:85 (-) Transcript_40011:6-260(-)